MNITFLSSRYPPDVIGGGEYSTAALAEALVSRGHTIHVLTGAEKEATEHRNGVHILRSPELFALWRKPLVEKAVSEQVLSALQTLLPTKTDILHAHDFRSALVLGLSSFPKRIATVRDYAAICGTTNNMWADGTSCDGCFWPNVLFRCHRVVEASLPRKPFRIWQYKWNLAFRTRMFERIPHHVYISNALQKKIGTRLSQKNIHTTVIPNPVGEEWLVPPTLYPAKKNVVYAGTVESYKGIDSLLEACVRVFQVHADATLTLLGAGDITHYTKKAAQLGIQERVHFLGKSSAKTVRDAMDSAALVVQPSVWEEPFGRTVIEAGARARPVVATATGGLSETLSSWGCSLVPPHSSEALSEAILDVLKGPKKAATDGKRYREYVEEQYSSTAIASRYEAVYKNI